MLSQTAFAIMRAKSSIGTGGSLDSERQAPNNDAAAAAATLVDQPIFRHAPRRWFGSRGKELQFGPGGLGSDVTVTAFDGVALITSHLRAAALNEKTKFLAV